MARSTLVERHMARVKAEKANQGSEHGKPIVSDAYNLLLGSLAEDRRRLKTIQSIERKIEAKAGMLSAYQDWIDSTLKNGKGAQDNIMTTMMIWHIDVGSFDTAISIAEYAIRYDLKLPDEYNRNVATLLIDEFADAALDSKFADPKKALEALRRIGELTEPHDAPDQARAKLHKAIAYETLHIVDAGSDPETNDIKPEMLEMARQADKNLRRALELYGGIGVKKNIEQLERRIKKAQQPA
jgi:hypothetical protein